VCVDFYIINYFIYWVIQPFDYNEVETFKKEIQYWAGLHSDMYND